jgi:hypothetical protein
LLQLGIFLHLDYQIKMLMKRISDAVYRLKNYATSISFTCEESLGI